MIPNIFVSSTVADLHYLRDALRDAIDELSYHPVMSDYGEIGYLQPRTAAESCYATVSQCQMMVLIIGNRYGSVGNDGLSVTHREYRAAREAKLPTISFVEAKTMAFREAYEAAPDAALWDQFPQMDNPRATFSLIGEIADSPTFNAILPFASVSDAKRRLKLQIANFVGDRLAEAVSPSTEYIKEVLAEVKTIRSQLTTDHPSSRKADASRRYLIVARFLLSDKWAGYRSLLAQLFGDLDLAVPQLQQCANFEEVVHAAGHTLQVKKSVEPLVMTEEEYKIASFGAQSYVVLRDKTVAMNAESLEYFREAQRQLQVLLSKA